MLKKILIILAIVLIAVLTGPWILRLLATCFGFIANALTSISNIMDGLGLTSGFWR